MLQPKRIKYRKQQRGRRKGRAVAGSAIVFGEYGLVSLDNAWITARQIEAARRAITHHLKRGGQIWIRVFPDKPVTAKPAETRQGSGKGAVDHWVAVVRRGRVLFEVGDIKDDLAKEALRLAAHKLPIATRFVAKGAEAGEPAAEETAVRELPAVGVEKA
ncbi:MAG: 50S ribosomal protein L16 [Chloroflexi bacterium]|nr:50S ribosomal protein L16 [Chloroflexota bacterium]